MRHYFAASLTSPSCTVFLPACLEISAALEEIFTAISVRTSLKVSTAPADTLLAPALIKILARVAFGIVEVFRPIISPHLKGENQKNPFSLCVGYYRRTSYLYNFLFRL